MMGGGFGGCVIALAPEAKAGTARSAVADAYAAASFAPPHSFLAHASDGAVRL